MKHQAITNLKFKSLSTKLKLPLWQTVGLLESLWLFAIHHARNGDLSRFPASDIAAWLEYDGDAADLINALVESRWLDRQGDMIVIHDWADHRPTWLKGVEASKLSAELSTDTKGATKSGTKSPTKPDAKSGTKQVRLGLVGLGTNQVSIPREEKPKRFKKPSADEVQAYCDKRKNGITGDEFVDHYEQVGWVCGKNRSPMQDWKAAVRTWETKRKQKPTESRIATAEDLEVFDLVTGAVR